MGKGEDLNKRVWTLFEKAGFETNPNSEDPAEYEVQLTNKKKRPVDLFAKSAELGVTILGSNKSMPKLKSYTTHIHDLEKLTNAAKANVALFVAADKEMLEDANGEEHRPRTGSAGTGRPDRACRKQDR